MFEKFRSSQTTVTAELLEFIANAWTEYVQSEVNKGLPASLTKGKEKDEWPQLLSQFSDKTWKQDCLKRDAKFEMHFNAAVRASNAATPSRILMVIVSRIRHFPLFKKGKGECSKAR